MKRKDIPYIRITMAEASMKNGSDEPSERRAVAPGNTATEAKQANTADGMSTSDLTINVLLLRTLWTFTKSNAAGKKR